MIRLLASCCAAVLAICIAAPLQAAVDHQSLDAAIGRAVKYLYDTQRSGNWEKMDAPDPSSDRTEPDGGQFGGTTALCVYALLSAGENPQDEKLKPAIEFLLRARMTGVYAVGMRTQVWNLLPASDPVKQAMQRDMQFLQRALIRQGDAKGFYDYLEPVGAINRIDHSVSQFGVLGAWVCAEHLGGFDAAYWQATDAAWRATQHSSGAWSYAKAPTARYPATVAMTAAGVATLFITQDFISRGRSAEPSGNGRDVHIDRGLKWVADNYDTLMNGPRIGQNFPYYGLYGVERIGVASGYRYFGKVNWYDDGADFLLKNQNRNGGWSGTINSALALLFLTRGRAPILMNKLEYDLVAANGRATKANWNQRPRDAANLAKYVGRQTEQTLNWQIIDLNASVAELLDSPILYISGNQALSFTEPQKQKLRDFLEQGGLILAHADASSIAFANSLKRLFTQMLGHEFRPLPADHIIYTDAQFTASRWKRKPNTLGLSNGVRELVLLITDGDPARAWQSYDLPNRPENFELIANIFQYSIDKQNARKKGQRYTIARDETIPAGAPLKLARIKHAGNWNPEPAGWRRLSAMLHNSDGVELDVQTVEIAALGKSEARIAHLTATGALRLTTEARDAIKTYIAAGGTLLIDSAGGSTAFSESIEQELKAIFPGESAALSNPLPFDDPIYTTPQKVEIAYRTFMRRKVTGDLKAPRLRGLTIDGRLAVIYSPEDLSAGLVGQPIDGILGYTPETATSLVRNIVRRAAVPQGGN